MPKTIFHIGVHKTATTFLQRKLAMNVDQLAEHGVFYLPLDILRKNFTACLNNQSPNEVVDQLRAAVKKSRVIISDENIAGAPGDVVRTGTYYPNITKRLRKAQELVQTTDVELYVSFREYSSFIVSMYCEYIRHRDFMDFQEYLAVFEKSEFSWRKVMADIRLGAPKAKITLWDFKNFRTLENKIFSDMIGYDATLLLTPDGPIRESFSAVALQALTALQGTLEPQLIKKLVQPISRSLPKGPDFPAFDPLPATYAEGLKKAYANDMEAIAAKYRDIRIL